MASETIEVEIDNIHMLMWKEMTEGEDIDLEEWAQNSLHQLIYSAHQSDER